MKRLLTLEYYKNFTYRPFVLCSLVYFVAIVGLLFIGLVDINIIGIKVNLKEQEDIYNFPEIWNFMTWIVALFKIILGFIIIFSICQEFTNRMFKQNMIDGLSRKDFVLSKLLTIGVLSLFSTLLVFVITFLIGMKYSESTAMDLVFREMYFVINYFVKLFTFFTFLMFLSVLGRKSIFVILSLFAWSVIETILMGIEYFFMKDSWEKMDEADIFRFSELLPLESMSKLIPNPIIRTEIVEQMIEPYVATYPTMGLVMCVVWTAVFICGTYFILKKRDW